MQQIVCFSKANVGVQEPPTKERELVAERSGAPSGPVQRRVM